MLPGRAARPLNRKIDVEAPLLQSGATGDGRRAADRTSAPITDSPSAKRRSNSELFIELHLLVSEAAKGDQTDGLLELGVHGGPVATSQTSNDQEAGLTAG
jgi:hypothetical protein